MYTQWSRYRDWSSGWCPNSAGWTSDWHDPCRACRAFLSPSVLPKCETRGVGPWWSCDLCHQPPTFHTAWLSESKKNVPQTSTQILNSSTNFKKFKNLRNSRNPTNFTAQKETPFEVFAPQIHQTFARLSVKSFVGAEQGPILTPSCMSHDEFKLVCETTNWKIWLSFLWNNDPNIRMENTKHVSNHQRVMESLGSHAVFVAFLTHQASPGSASLASWRGRGSKVPGTNRGHVAPPCHGSCEAQWSHRHPHATAPNTSI